MNSIAREARLVLPRDVKPAPDAVHPKLCQELARAFGGNTRTQGQGGWIDQDTDQLVEDLNWIYDIAMPDEFQYFRQLKEIAIRYGRLLNQKAVYIRMPGGQVEIVELTKTTWGPPAHHDTLAGYPGEGATANAERKLGIRRLPKTNEVWKTASGGRAATISRASLLGGGWDCILLQPGSTALGGGHRFAVNLDGKAALLDGGPHPLDLVSFVSSF
jgi:hypothetical protein